MVASKIDNINNGVAQFFGKIFGHMYFFYFCVILDLAELPPVWSAHSVITWVTYISQTVIQLLALPVITYLGNQQSQNHTELKAHIDGHVKGLHAAIAEAGQENS